MKSIKLSPDAAVGSPPDAFVTAQQEAQKVIASLAPFAALAGPDGALALAVAQGALALYSTMIPLLEQLASGGVITPAQQQAVLDQHDQIANNLDTAFGGPAWQVS